MSNWEILNWTVAGVGFTLIMGHHILKNKFGINLVEMGKSKIEECKENILGNGYNTLSSEVTEDKSKEDGDDDSLPIVAGDKNRDEEDADSSENPLESFTIVFENFNHKIFDNLAFNMFFNYFLIIFIFSIFFFNSRSLFMNVDVIKTSENIFNFFFSMFKNFIKNLRFERFFFFLITFFVFILFANFGGFSLYELSFTSHAAITIFLSFILFFNYFINILINFNEKIYLKFIQKNLNPFLTFILFFIELISFFIRPFSLGIRLFANILSGHILIHIFFNAFIYFYKVIFWLSFFLLIFCFFILFLEIFVACVQSYIFLILSFIYLQDVSKLH